MTTASYCSTAHAVDLVSDAYRSLTFHLLDISRCTAAMKPFGLYSMVRSITTLSCAQLWNSVVTSIRRARTQQRLFICTKKAVSILFTKSKVITQSLCGIH